MSPPRRWRTVASVVFVAGAVAVPIWLYVLTAKVNRVEAVRQGAIQADYNACVGSIPLLRKIDKFIVGTEAVADVLIRNSADMHRITPKTSPVYRQQAINLRRLRARVADGKGVRLPVPTVRSCAAERDRDLAR